MAESLQFKDFDGSFLKASAEWQQDAEIRQLIDAAPFSSEQQQQWFLSLPTRTDYKIWGIALDGEPVGAVGLKDITEEFAEYFGYLGNKSCWGRGFGASMMAFAEEQAGRLGVGVLRLRVLNANTRATRLYLKCGYKYCMRPDSLSGIMVKVL